MVPCLQCIHLYMRKKYQIDKKFHQKKNKKQSLGCGKIPTDQVQQHSHIYQYYYGLDHCAICMHYKV